MELDKAQYKSFRDEPPTRMGKRIELIEFNKEMNPVHFFHEYTGTLQEASPFRVRFAEGPLFHRVVVLNGTSSTRELSTQFIMVFSTLFFTYMWRYIDGDETETALDLSNVGGKTKRKRRKSKLKTKRS